MMNTDGKNNRLFKRSFWVAFAFYFLIGFEFLYMVSPFAVYFYGVYRPGLSLVNDHPTLAWLSTIFLPHIVSHTRSWLLDVIRLAGAILATCGLGVFCIGALQVYYYKLARKKVVTSGIYGLIRHPQYAALAVSGLGLLILWPRYIVLISYIAMLFFYYHLALYEEKICEMKYGDKYRVYRQQTSMFFPINFGWFARFNILPHQGPYRYLGIIGGYVICCMASVLLANQIRDWSLDQIYALYTDDAVVISVTALEEKEMADLLNIAVQTPAIAQRLAVDFDDNPIKYLNYIVPTDWSASEVPMNPVENIAEVHGYPKDKPIPRYKIVFTWSIPRASGEMKGKNILFNTTGRFPLLEVIVDVASRKVVQIGDPVKGYRLDGVPLPLF